MSRRFVTVGAVGSGASSIAIAALLPGIALDVAMRGFLVTEAALAAAALLALAVWQEVAPTRARREPLIVLFVAGLIVLGVAGLTLLTTIVGVAGPEGDSLRLACAAGVLFGGALTVAPVAERLFGEAPARVLDEWTQPTGSLAAWGVVLQILIVPTFLVAAISPEARSMEAIASDRAVTRGEFEALALATMATAFGFGIAVACARRASRPARVLPARGVLLTGVAALGLMGSCAFLSGLTADRDMDARFPAGGRGGCALADPAPEAPVFGELRVPEPTPTIHEGCRRAAEILSADQRWSARFWTLYAAMAGAAAGAGVVVGSEVKAREQGASSRSRTPSFSSRT